MKRIMVLLIILISIQTISADVSIYTKPINMTCGGTGEGTINNFYQRIYGAHYYSVHALWTFYGADCNHCYSICAPGHTGSKIRAYYMKGGYEYNFFTNCSLEGVTFSKSDTVNGYQDGYYAYYDYHIKFIGGWDGYSYDYCLADGIATLIVSPDPPNTVSGTAACIDKTELYIKNNAEWIICDESMPENYSFKIYNGSEYKLVFSDGHEYEFTCNGSDVQYDYDACNYGIINLYDNCANLLINPFIVVYNLDDNMNIVYSGHDNPVTFLPSIVDENDELDVIWSTWQGTFQKRCFAQFDHPINLYDQSIHWNLGIHVWDENVYQCPDALVIYDQDCIINGYPKRNGFSDSDGYIEFTQCENDNGNLTVDKSGYKSLNVEVVNTFDAQTKNYGVNVFLELDNSSDETDWSMVNDSWNDTNMTEMPEDMGEGIEYTMLLYFRDPDGYKTNCVLSNTSYVRCFYGIKYPAPVNMQLDFERSVNGLGYTTLCSYPYSIDNNSCGYWEINNSYFSDPDYIYRAHIYDQTDEHIGRHAYLRVIAAPEEQNYTAYTIFSPNEPLIDYREYIKGKVFANATSGSLPDLSLELYDESDLIEYFNYTQSDFDSYGWAYWLLGYNYTLHHNYTLLLKNDVGDIVSTAYTYAKDLRGNKLTIKVIDSTNNPLDHSYIFLKDYGRIPTNNQCYGTFEGLANQDYYYKAEKGGYRSTGWDMVSPIDEDTLVTYTLIPESSVYQNRMAKTDVKKLYYPFMYILLIIMLVGGLIHVFN